jgi:hypothetical protein
MNKIKKSSWGGKRKGAGRPRNTDNQPEDLLAGMFEFKDMTSGGKTKLNVEGPQFSGRLYLEPGQPIPKRIILKAGRRSEPGNTVSG